MRADHLREFVVDLLPHAIEPNVEAVLAPAVERREIACLVNVEILDRRTRDVA